MDIRLFPSSHQIEKVPILPSDMNNDDVREKLESALQDPLARIPFGFQDFYYQFQNIHQRQFLQQVNFIAQLAFLLYFFADAVIIADMSIASGLIRIAAVTGVFALNVYLFKYIQNIRLLDLVLPISTLVAAIIWFELLLLSTSTLVHTYQYAAMILIVLGNLGVQIHFRQSLVTSALITIAIFQGVFRLNTLNDSLIFIVSYVPILIFALYISWNNTLNGRCNFLRSLLDDWNFYKLNELAHTDELTQLNNRRQFIHIAERRMRDVHPNACSLLLFDVDNFKKINDQYGHDIGDVVLQRIAAIARQEMRIDDVLARFGGEEFISLLTHTHLKDACLIAERLRQKIEAHQILLEGNLQIQFTVSIGIAEFQPEQHNLNGLIKAADLALYFAKQNGRNRIAHEHDLKSA